MTSLRDLARRLAPQTSAVPLDQAFVARVREQLGPVLAGGHFRFDAAQSVADRASRRTSVRYCADPVVFAAGYPGMAGALRAEGSPLECTVALDVDRRTVHVEIESFELAALLSVVRAGPGAPPRRRRLDVDGLADRSPEDAVTHAAELLRRLFEDAGPR